MLSLTPLTFSLSLLTLITPGTSQLFTNSTNSSSSSSAVVHYLSTPSYNHGATFGLPWPESQFPVNTTSFSTSDGTPLQSWITGYWADGSIKWSGHAIPASDTVSSSYTITASKTGSNTTASLKSKKRAASGITVEESGDLYTVNTRKITVSFPKSGANLISSIITSDGKTIGTNGRLVVQSQSSPDSRNTSTQFHDFQSSISSVEISAETTVRTLITVHGTHAPLSGATHKSWLPFVVRFYLYSNSDAIKILHSLVFDGNASTDFISSIGLRFSVPLSSNQLYDRHVLLAGVDGGVLGEAVQGITGLRRDPGAAVKAAQIAGQKLPEQSTWDVRVSGRLKWIPGWNDYSLFQGSADGFTLQKRTKEGQSWVKIPSGTRAGGLAYLGGADGGGLAVGLRDFWKRYPSGIEISNAATETGDLTIWLYSPEAPVLDMRPFHDGLGQTGYKDELDALEITYEDWEEGFNTPYGIARTSELYLFGFSAVPSKKTFSSLTEYIHDPPTLVATPERIEESKALGTYWGLPDTTSEASKTIEKHLDFLFDFYVKQVEERRWYGFLDYGDFMHAYDVDRHTWRYDVGGYAWDNSELSPDLFFWLYFLRTGRSDAYRFAEALTRHTGEVDVYHIGQWKGLGTRHGVQHWADSAKQARISQPQYRKYFFYLSGGDERIGSLLDESLDTDLTYGVLDPQRKVRTDGWVPTPNATVAFSLGTDWSALAGGWLIAWERRGTRWEEARQKLNSTMTGIANLKNGFVTGSALYDLQSWSLGPPPTDPTNNGTVAVSHLSAVFGLPEVVSEAIAYFGDAVPTGFAEKWEDYCYYYGVSKTEQAARYGVNFGTLSLLQPHSRLAAYAANQQGNVSVAKRAWKAFYQSDGLLPTAPWNATVVGASDVLVEVEEATWLATNDVAQYGLAAIQNLKYIRDALEGWNT